MDRSAPGTPSHLFAVRVWTEQVAGGVEHRGSVRDVVSGALSNFRSWPDLTAFIVSCIDERRGLPGPGQGGA